MRAATASVGLVSPRSTWLSICAETAGAVGQVAQREVHRLAQRAHARPDVELLGERWRRPCGAYVITDDCPWAGWVWQARARRRA